MWDIGENPKRYLSELVEKVTPDTALSNRAVGGRGVLRGGAGCQTSPLVVPTSAILAPSPSQALTPPPALTSSEIMGQQGRSPIIAQR